ncbi:MULTISPECIES: DUF3810 domain-containing protein [Maribacter]|uniref:DUF3810 domain-containing protein n=1 Tax=Maribacter flavus TaxID=1658664 RepID=A0ABU7IN55_9FLAO|nr:DUF3810 domain-containing protein [Maribacter flavus]MEE1974088.1 DUF3810 domain-containing protein [Maribacter flavus]
MSLKTVIAVSLIPQIMLVKWLGQNTDFIESYYSMGLYPHISGFFRWLFGWIPFSVGDLLYFLLICTVIFYLYRRWTFIKTQKLKFLRDVLMVLSIAYLTFHLVWGFNYYRRPLSEKLGLTETKDYRELLDFTERLIQKTNSIQEYVVGDTLEKVNIPYSQNEMFQMSIEGYHELAKEFGFLGYEHPSVKTSLFSTGLTYMGYAGYLNPFTNEAQVNGILPNFRFPIVTGHEIGHQLGYSAENETNFIGYLVTSKNKDPYFQYAAYAYVMGYCLSDVRRGNRETFDRMFQKLNPGVRANFEEMALFWEQYENPLEPVFKSIFNSFLKANNQEQGIRSYNGVVSLVIAYHKKYPL